jgi:outer membrane lipoprotein-sorting protein
MKRAAALIAGAMALAGASAQAQTKAQAPAPTADDIIARQVAARGGLDKLKAIQSLKFDGTMLVYGGAIRLHVVELKKRPGLVREEASLQGLTNVQAYDGTGGWQIQPFQGRRDPERMSADDSKELADDADIDEPIVDYKAKGGAVEYLGEEDVDGTAAYKLRLTEKSGDQLTYFIDTDTLMTIRVASKRLLRGREETSVTDYGDYEKVGGVYFPFESESGPPGASDQDKTKVIFDTGEADVAIDDAKFRMGGK